MSTLLSDIQNLSVAEKAALYNLLQTDTDVNDYLREQENEDYCLKKSIGEIKLLREEK